MPRVFSTDTVLIYHWLWYLPWASAPDIARVTGLKLTAVSNVLSRGRERGWLRSARLGRAFPATDRFVFSNTGVEALNAKWGWEIFWWHTAGGVRALARRLEVVEMAYAYLPLLWQSNLVRDRNCHVYREWFGADRQTGGLVRRTELVESDWSEGRLVGFHWERNGAFEAIATYDDGGHTNALLHLPVLWRASFQKPSDIASVRRDMSRVLTLDERWQRLPHAQAISPDYRPGMVIFCSNRVAAAMVQRNWRDALTGNNATAPAIIDAQGQVVRAMTPPTTWWQAFTPPPRGGPLKDISQAVTRLASGAYAAVNGMQSWRTFRAIDGSPGVTLDQIAASVGVDPTLASKLLEPMVNAKVISAQADGHYLDVSGRGLLASSERKTPKRTARRWGVYAQGGGEYQCAQRLHNQGQAETIRQLRRNGFAAFPSLGIVIDYWHQGRLIRVVPDVFVVLAPGVLVAVEFERSARTPGDLKEKAEKYKRLDEIVKRIPVLFVTETEEAARILAELGYNYLLATTLDAVREGPHGRAIMQDDVVEGEPGCWWYWYSDEEAPTSDNPIDMWSHLYVQSDQNSAWRLPLDEPFRLV